MAKLKINEKALQVDVPEELAQELKHGTMEVINPQPEPNHELINLSEEVDALKLELIAIHSQHEQELSELKDKLDTVQRPIVKEITLDKTNSDDIDALERSIIKTIDKLNSDRKEESEAIEKALKNSNKLQNAINIITIVAIMAIVFLK